MSTKFNKTISFYNISLSYNPLNIQSATSDNGYVKSIFDTIFPEGVYLYKINDEYLMDILEYTDEYIYAMICKNDTPTIPMSHIREQDNSTHPFKLNKGQQLEKYTYIYIDIKNLKISYLVSQSIREPNRLLIEMTNRISYNCIEITPIIIENPSEYFKNNYIEKATFSEIEPDGAKKLISKMYNSDIGIKKVHLNIDFNESDSNKVWTFVKKLVRSNSHKTINLITKNKENNLISVIDAITNCIKLKSEIELTDNQTDNQHIIKNILKNELAKMILNKMI